MIDVPPVSELPLPHPDDLTLGELFAIRAATGVDVQEPQSGVEQITALLWFALKSKDHNVSWSDVLQLRPKALEPHWEELKQRSIKRAVEDLARAEKADQARDDAAAMAEQREALGELEPEPGAPTVDPTSPAATERRT